MFSLLYKIIKFVLLAILPFILLIRVAVYGHVTYQLDPWVAIGAGVAATALALFVYFSVIYGKLSGKLGSARQFKRRAFIALILVGVYCVHGLFYFSSSNLKNQALQTELNKVHPILRLSVSTIAHLDKDLIVTDANRTPEDYKKMGLKVKKHSLHYQQEDGYAHALDLRTNQRSELRNQLLEKYFRWMGFNTLRHTGTGDHLHISLKSHERPNAI